MPESSSCRYDTINGGKKINSSSSKKKTLKSSLSNKKNTFEKHKHLSWGKY